jgi:hypothetical protein
VLWVQKSEMRCNQRVFYSSLNCHIPMSAMGQQKKHQLVQCHLVLSQRN